MSKSFKCCVMQRATYISVIMKSVDKQSFRSLLGDCLTE